MAAGEATERQLAEALAREAALREVAELIVCNDHNPGYEGGPFLIFGLGDDDVRREIGGLFRKVLSTEPSATNEIREKAKKWANNFMDAQNQGYVAENTHLQAKNERLREELELRIFIHPNNSGMVCDLCKAEQAAYIPPNRKAAHKPDCLLSTKLSAPDVAILRCYACQKPATCNGTYEGSGVPGVYACDDCCGHGNEDGECTPIIPATDKVLVEQKDLILRGEVWALQGLRKENDRLQDENKRLLQILKTISNLGTDIGLHVSTCKYLADEAFNLKLTAPEDREGKS